MIIPIFPLEIVQFPGVGTPLHIFEPRYRQLLTDIQKTDNTFGIILMSKSDSPAAGAVGCTVEVVANKTMEDGRSNILCAGKNRFTVKRLVDGEPYQQAEIEFFGDDLIFDEDFVLRDKSKGLFTQLIKAAMQLNEVNVTEIPELPSDPVTLSFVISSSLDVELEEKQMWLEMTKTNLRLSRLNNRLKDMIEHLQLRLEVQQFATQRKISNPDTETD